MTHSLMEMTADEFHRARPRRHAFQRSQDALAVKQAAFDSPAGNLLLLEKDGSL